MKKLLMALVVVSLLLCCCACSGGNGETNSNGDGGTTNGVVADSKYDVSKYASITSEELIKILGQPSTVDDGYGKGFCDIPCVYYNYENHETFGSLSFAIINNKVARLSSYKTYDYNESELSNTEGLLNYFGIKKQEACETIVQNDLAHRYRCPSANVDDFYIGLIGQAKDDSFGILEVTYDMSYYEEWYLPYEYDEWTNYKAITETTVKSMLHSPDSAKFPYDGWEFAKNDYYFKVTGSVNAQNLFGATLTYDFTFIYDNSGECAYAIFGDEVVNNGYEETKKKIKATFDKDKHKQALDAATVKANVQENPSGDNSTPDNDSGNNKPNTNTNTNSNKNNLYDVQDAVIEYCNKYNANSRKYSESIGCFVDSGTQVRISHSAYNIPESDSSYIYSARDTMLNNLISHLEKYGFPQSITVTVEEDYNFISNDYGEDDTPAYEDNNENWVYEENDINSLTAAVNAFCSGHHTCDYGCTLNPKVTSKTSVDIYHTVDYDIPIADTQKISAIDKQIKIDIESFVSNYANFPEGITFRVIPDYWYATSNNKETLDSAMAAFVSDYQCAYGAITYKLNGAKLVTINYDVSRDVPQSELNEVESQIRKDAEDFVSNYANFPENITFSVFPNYWYEPNQ